MNRINHKLLWGISNLADFIGRSEKLTERIIQRLFIRTEVFRQVPISKLISNENFIEYGEEFSKHTCDLVMKVITLSGETHTLVIEVNYKHGPKAARKWSQTFAPDILANGNIPVTIDDYDCRDLFKKNDKKQNVKLIWNHFRDIIDQLEKAGVNP